MRKQRVRKLSANTLPAVEGCFSAWIDRTLAWGVGLLCLFISISFYTATYDTAFVKITLFHMGGIVLAALWGGLLLVQRRWPFTRQNLMWLLPFLVYFGWNVLSYVCGPYKWEGANEALRYVLYFIISLLILDRFDMRAARVLTRCVVAAAWISCVYGLVQVVDHWLPGVDIMPWRGFFGTRIFSTHANPNFFADFLVFSSFIIAVEYLRTRYKRLLVLMGILLVDLFFSESKGAWLGFAASAVFFVAAYSHALSGIRTHTRYIKVCAVLVLLAVCTLAGFYAAKRFQSVSFRAYTWAAAFDMVQDSPVLGTGVGSFKVIYPAYRKPQIFYLEKYHNTETQHAENEYLEQWATAGTVGLAIFLWLLFFVLYTGWRGVKSKDGPFDERTWLTLGYTAAFFGICVHSIFDISIRFVSTGLFFAVFSAVVVRLNMPASSGPEKLPAPSAPGWLWIARGFVCAATGCLVIYLLHGFYEISSAIEASTAGAWLVKLAAWAVFGGLTLLAAWVYVRTAWLARWVRVCVVLVLSTLALYGVFGFFQADHYYGLAVGFSNRQMTDGALDFYQRAIKKNPFFTSYRQYRAYILRTTMDMQRSYSPIKGDEKLSAGQRPLNDYERVLRDLEIVRRHSPNNALLWQAYGEFYYTYAVYYTKLSMTEPLAYQRAEYEKRAVENMEQAKKSFRRSLLLDPVNPATYVYLASIAQMERNPAASQAWIDAYRRGPERVIEPEFLATHKSEPQLDALERKLRQLPFNYFPEK